MATSTVENPVRKGDLIVTHYTIRGAVYVNHSRKDPDQTVWFVARVHSATRDGLIKTYVTGDHEIPSQTHPTLVMTLSAKAQAAAAPLLGKSFMNVDALRRAITEAMEA